jgi:hypothetical protein
MCSNQLGSPDRAWPDEGLNVHKAKLNMTGGNVMDFFRSTPGRNDRWKRNRFAAESVTQFC